MNLIYICPNFPENYHRFCVALSQCGVTVLGIGDAPYDWLQPDLKDALREYYKVSSLENHAEVLDAGFYFKNKYGPIGKVESLQEYWLPLEAMLREQLDAPGKKTDEIGSLRKKSVMKELFRKAGVDVVRGELLKDYDQALSFISRVDYPIIIKPDSGVGASQVYKIQAEKDLLDFYKNKDKQSYFMEEFISGELISLDGLVDAKGEIVFTSTMDFPLTIMEVVHDNRDLHYMIRPKIPADLLKAGKKIVEVFDLRERFFHFEFFREKVSNKLIALEVNLRPPGLLTTDMWNYAFDMDIYAKWARLLAANQWENPGEAKYAVCYVSRKKDKKYKYSHEQVLDHCWPHLVCFEEIPEIYRNVGGDIAYLLRAEKGKILEPLIKYIQAKK